MSNIVCDDNSITALINDAPSISATIQETQPIAVSVGVQGVPGVIALTTNGNSGASTFINSVLNIPTPTLTGLGAQPALGYTAENIANKTIDLTSNDNTHYPTTAAVNTGLASKQNSLGYTPANKAGDTFTGAISATNLSGTNTGDETNSTIISKIGYTPVSPTDLAKKQVDTGVLDWTTYGFVGNGIANDTAKLNTALADSASTGKWLILPSGMQLGIASTQSKTIRGDTGGTGGAITKNVGVVVPTGAKWDGNGVILKQISSSDFIVMGNQTMNGTSVSQGGTDGDIFTVKNVIIDGGGYNRTVPMVWWWGLNTGSYLYNIEVRNTQYTAFVMAAFYGVEIDKLKARDIIGQGLQLGGNNDNQCAGLRVGTLFAERIANYGTFNQPGNGIFVGARASSFLQVYGRNCAGGHKFGPNCADLDIVDCLFDGLVLSGETDYGTTNSGTKLQGDDFTTSAKRISIGKVQSRNCKGAGLFLSFTLSCQIKQYHGYNNNILGTENGDIVCNDGNMLQLGDIHSSYCGGTGFYMNATTTANSGHYQVDSLIVYNTGQTSTASVKVGANITGGRGIIKTIIVHDDQTTPTTSKGIQSTSILSSGYFEILNLQFYAPGGISMDLRHVYGIIRAFHSGSGTPALSGEVTLTAGTTTTVSFGNIISVTTGSPVGYVEPQIILTPMNSAASAFIIPRATFSTGTLTLTHNTATGTEKYAFTIGNYAYKTDKAS